MTSFPPGILRRKVGLLLQSIAAAAATTGVVATTKMKIAIRAIINASKLKGDRLRTDGLTNGQRVRKQFNSNCLERPR
jgi:hypothetical protein